MKPKEWWITPNADYCGEFIFEDPSDLFDSDESVHVVEKLSYDKAIAALNEICQTMHLTLGKIDPNYFENRVGEMWTTAANALKELGELSDKKVEEGT